MWYPLEEMYIDNTAGVSERRAGHNLHPGLTGLCTIVRKKWLQSIVAALDVIGASTIDELFSYPRAASPQVHLVTLGQR